MGGCGNAAPSGGDKTVREVNQSAKEKPQTTTVRRQDVVDAIYYDGQVFYKTTQMSFPSEGTFDTFKVEIGESVTKGQVLATTQNTVGESEYKKLKESADSIQQNYNYDSAIKELELEKLELELDLIYKEIDETDVNSSYFTTVCRKAGVKYREIEAKKLEIAQLKETYDFQYPYYNNKVKEYKKTMGKNVIKAPFSGTVVSMINTQSGAFVDSDTYVIALADTNYLCVYCDYMTENYVNGLEDVYALIDGKKYEVKYTELDKELYLKLQATETTMYSVFTIVAPDENVAAGDVAKLVLVRKRAENSVTVPKNAVTVDASGRCVYVEGPNGKEKRNVTLGVFDGAYYEVRQGLSEGEVIYVGK